VFYTFSIFFKYIYLQMYVRLYRSLAFLYFILFTSRTTEHFQVSVAEIWDALPYKCRYSLIRRLIPTLAENFSVHAILLKHCLSFQYTLPVLI